MRSTALHTPLRFLSGEEPVDQAGSKRIAAADAVINFNILAGHGLVKTAGAIADCAPIIQGSSFHSAQSRGHHRNVWKFPDDLLNHLLEAIRIKVRVIIV